MTKQKKTRKKNESVILKLNKPCFYSNPNFHTVLVCFLIENVVLKLFWSNTKLFCKFRANM